MVPRLVKITIAGVTRVVDLLRNAALGYGRAPYGTSRYGE